MILCRLYIFLKLVIFKNRHFYTKFAYDFFYFQLDTAAKKLSSIESKIQEVQKKIQQLNEEMDVNVMKEEIVAKTKIRNEMETLLNKVDEEIASLLKQSALQAELELNKSTLLSKKQEIEKLRDKHEKEIITLLDIKKLPQTKLKTNLDMVQKQLVF